MPFPEINTHRLSREEYSTIATAFHGLMKQKGRGNNHLPLSLSDKSQKYFHEKTIFCPVVDHLPTTYDTRGESLAQEI